MTILKTILISLAILVLSSCSSEKQLAKAINKHGQKESCAYFVSNYPEYFKATMVRDTIEIRDTIYAVVPDYVHDTLVVFDSTYKYQSDRLKLEIVRLGKKLSVKATCVGDTVYVPYTKEVPVTVACPPCPDISVLADKETFMQKVYKVWTWFTLGIFVPGACILALLYFTKKDNKSNSK